MEQARMTTTLADIDRLASSIAALVTAQSRSSDFWDMDDIEEGNSMIIRPIRLDASRFNRRQTNHQWRSKRSEMQFRRHLAIRYGGWRDRYVRMPMDMRLWKMSMMGVAHIGHLRI